MPAAIIDKEQPQPSVEGNGQAEEPSKKKRTGSPFMYALRPDFLSEPRPLEFANGMDSRELAWEKCTRTILQALEIKSEKEWLKFAQQVWAWAEEAEERERAAALEAEAQRKEAAAEELLNLIGDDPKLLKSFQAKLATLMA